MDTNWSVEAGLDDPVVVIPWTLSETTREAESYIDLGIDPKLLRDAIDRIPEALAWPEVRLGLLVLNGQDSPVRTTKCDAWLLDEEEKQLDFGQASSGYGAYFDLLSIDPHVFASLTSIQDRAERWSQLAARLGPDDARADFVVRPALWNGAEGFALTAYVFGFGRDAGQARIHWSEAMQSVCRVIAGGDDTMTLRASSSIG